MCFTVGWSDYWREILLWILDSSWYCYVLYKCTVGWSDFWRVILLWIIDSSWDCYVLYSSVECLLESNSALNYIDSSWDCYVLYSRVEWFLTKKWSHEQFQNFSFWRWLFNQCTLGWSDFWRKKLDSCHLVWIVLRPLFQNLTFKGCFLTWRRASETFGLCP